MSIVLYSAADMSYNKDMKTTWTLTVSETLNRREFGVLRDMADYVTTPMLGRRNDGTAVFPHDQPLFTESAVRQGLLENVGREPGGVDVFRVTAEGHAMVAEWRAGRWLPA